MINSGQDTEDNRKESIAVMAANGCRSTRFIKISDGTIRCHGYLEELEFPIEEEVQ